MAAYFIVSISIGTSPEGVQARGTYDHYIAQVRPVVERFGGEYLVRSEKVAHLEGEWRPDRVIVIRFPSREELGACFSSPEYRDIVSLRTTSVAASAVIVED